MNLISIATTHRDEFVDITAPVQDAVRASGCQNGVCHIFCAHTTAGLTVNENADPDVVHDILLSLNDIVKNLRGFQHAEGNSTAHVKSSLVGMHTCLPVEQGRLALGTWQGVYFCEFDGPRHRQVRVVCIPSPAQP